MPGPIRVSLAVTPDTQVAPLSGLFETLGAFAMLARLEPGIPEQPFVVEIVAVDAGGLNGASGLPIRPHRTCDQVTSSDIVVVPLMQVGGPDWEPGRSPETVAWLRRMHDSGARVCSTCTGVLLLAETGLLSGGNATIHWAFAPTFRRCFPDVRLHPHEALVTGGPRGDMVMTGGVTSWHDLVLWLIARHVGPAAARGMARLMMLDWHDEGQAPYAGFAPPRDHGDALVLELQDWVRRRFMMASPVEEMVARANLPRRSLERRFARATGQSPIDYVQTLRVEAAKRRLEASDAPVEEIGAEVGYENAAWFRRLFKRHTRMTPAAWRRRYSLPPGSV